MEEGFFSLEESEVSTEEAWQFYSQLDEFQNIVFDQFAARLPDNRQQVQKRKQQSAEQVVALAHDRQIYPRATHSGRGEPVFDLSPAKLLLRQDVLDKQHEKMTAGQLRLSRTEYRPFKLNLFRRRIYQEIRRNKYINWLQKKREDEKAKLI